MLTDFIRRSPFEERRALAHPFRSLHVRQGWFVPATNDLLRSADVISDEHGWRIRVALPGVEPENVHVAVAASTLHIRAAEQESDGEVVRYERQLTIPETVDAQQITATCRNGLLELRLPLTEAARPRRITVSTIEPKQLNA